MYYLRTRAAVDAIKFTVDQNSLKAKNAKDTSAPTNAPVPTTTEGPGECLSCGA